MIHVIECVTHNPESHGTRPRGIETCGMENEILNMGMYVQLCWRSLHISLESASHYAVTVAYCRHFTHPLHAHALFCSNYTCSYESASYVLHVRHSVLSCSACGMQCLKLPCCLSISSCTRLLVVRNTAFAAPTHRRASVQWESNRNGRSVHFLCSQKAHFAFSPSSLARIFHYVTG